MSTESRSLREKKKPKCKAMNPIDWCWRCKDCWAKRRRRLASCSKGVGRKAYGGGKKGEIYVVTDPSDNEMENSIIGDSILVCGSHTHTLREPISR